MTAASEQQLVARLQRGDHGALGLLLESYQHRLYNICLRMLGNRDDAAEAAQDTMLKIIEHVGEFAGQSAIATWMIRIAMNQSITRLRQRRVRVVTSLDGPGNGSADDQLTGLREQLADEKEPGPEQNVQQKEMFARLRTALDNLEEDFRAVLVLRDIEELNYDDIAAVLEVPVGTVKSRLFRARLALRQEMLKAGSELQVNRD